MSIPLNPSTTVNARQALAVDGRSLNALKFQSTQGDAQATQGAVQEAAKQLESLFMRELIKSMREATAKSGLLDGAEGNLANDLFDQQLSVQMSGLPGGLSDAIQRQLSKQLGGDGQTALVPGSTLSLDTTLRKAAPADNPRARGPKGRDDFVQHHRAAAERVAQDSGIPASFMLGQAGHETGWGKSEIKNADGSNAHNLFGIKAGAAWRGDAVNSTTTEYEAGVAGTRVERFRAYGSAAGGISDYVELLKGSPRYAAALGTGGDSGAFALALQRGGYATDPDYARKLSAVADGVGAILDGGLKPGNELPIPPAEGTT